MCSLILHFALRHQLSDAFFLHRRFSWSLQKTLHTCSSNGEVVALLDRELRSRTSIQILEEWTLWRAIWGSHVPFWHSFGYADGLWERHGCLKGSRKIQRQSPGRGARIKFVRFFICFLMVLRNWWKKCGKLILLFLFEKWHCFLRIEMCCAWWKRLENTGCEKTI